MNKLLGIIWSAVAVILLVILISGIKGKRFGFRTSRIVESGKLYSTDIFDADKIDSLDINLVSESFTIKGHNENVIKVELYCNEETAPSINSNSSTLCIESVRKNFSVSIQNRQVVVYVPYDKKFSKVDINVVSGSLHVSDLNCNNFSGKSVSGSGHYENCNFNRILAEQTSGSLHLRNVTGEKIDAHCVSGSISIEGDFKGLNVKSSSGSVNVSIKNALIYDSSVLSTSGSIRVSVPKNSDLSIEYKSNGIYKNHFTGTAGKSGTDRMGAGNVKLFLKATSGSISVD